jgi:hypothetical protein
VHKEITAAQAARLLEQVTPADAVAAARKELAAEFLADLRRAALQDGLVVVVLLRAAERTAVGPVEPGPGLGAAQCSDLVPQHEQLGVLGRCSKPCATATTTS